MANCPCGGEVEALVYCTACHRKTGEQNCRGCGRPTPQVRPLACPGCDPANRETHEQRVADSIRRMGTPFPAPTPEVVRHREGLSAWMAERTAPAKRKPEPKEFVVVTERKKKRTKIRTYVLSCRNWSVQS